MVFLSKFLTNFWITDPFIAVFFTVFFKKFSPKPEDFESLSFGFIGLKFPNTLLVFEKAPGVKLIVINFGPEDSIFFNSGYKF